ncbi:SGNH/GDSL hydrolase family protein [Pedobacter sp. AW1-32]|uniref:SGNH/GDSL hydrolase family protein n=1 Tax=Pedobacter sp. AW1-32 TaxID=3383026 RepID=UPI003FED7446
MAENNENQPIDEIAPATSIAGAKILGIAANGDTNLFEISDIKGDYKGLALPDTNPGVPVLAQSYDAKPGVTYPLFLGTNGQPISIPTSVEGKPVIAAKLIFNGSNWVAEYNGTDIDLVDYTKTKDLPIVGGGKNLANYQSYIDNSAIEGSTGNLIYLDGGRVSTPIKVSSNTNYTYSGNEYSRIAFRDMNFNNLGGLGEAGDPHSFRTPFNCAYVIVNLKNPGETQDNIQLEYGSVATNFEPFIVAFSPESIQGGITTTRSLGQEMSSNSDKNGLYVLNNDVSNIHKTEGSSLTLNKNTSPSLQQLMLVFNTSNEGYNQFDLMTAGKVDYTVTSVMGFWIDTTEFTTSTTLKLLLYFFDRDINDIGNHQELELTKANLTSKGYFTQNGAILEVQIKEVIGDWSYVEYLIKPNIGIVNVDYFRVYFVLNPLVANKNYNFSSFTFLNGYNQLNAFSTYSLPEPTVLTHNNDKCIFFGDSITAADQYQKEIQKRLGIVYKNNAVPGSCVTPGFGANPSGGVSLVDRLDAVNSENAKVIGVFAGTNDYGYEVPLGNISDTDITTFYGAYRTLLSSLQTNNPYSIIFTITPLFGNNGMGPSAGKTNEEVWNLRKPFVDAIIELSNLFSIPVFDAFRLSGIGITNYPQWLADTIHPNEAGYKKIGVLFSLFLRNIL